MDKKKKLTVVLSLCWVTYVAAYLCRINLSTVLDKLSIGIDISLELLGTASSVYFITYAVGQLLNGIIGDRVNPHRFVMLALFMTGGINTVIGLQSSGTAFVLLWGLNGACQSMFWSTLLRLLSVYTEEEQRKNVSTLMSMTCVVSYLLSWVVLSWCFKPFSHVPYFVVPGIIALMLIPLWYMLSKTLPFESSSGNKVKAPPLAVVASEFMHDRLWYVCLLCMVVGSIQEGAVFWMPMIFSNVLALGENSLFMLALIPFAKMAGLFLARAVLAKMGENARRSMMTTLLFSLAVTALMLITAKNTSVITVLLIAALVVTINASNWFVISYLPLYFAHRNIVATLVGAFDFSTYVGAALMSGTLGDLLTSRGWTVLPLLWMMLIVIALLLLIGGAGNCLARKGARR